MNPCYVYDITAPADQITKEAILTWCDENTKKYCFQLEKGEETGYLHYQCRVSLKDKIRLSTMIRLCPWGHVSVTSAKNMGNNFYVMKNETKVDGPWTNIKEFTTRDVAVIEKLLPWQQKVIDLISIPDDRIVHYIYDPVGNNGKTTFTKYCIIKQIAKFIPPINDSKDICQAVCCMGEADCYIMDMPRAMPKNKLQTLYAAIEQVKSGMVFDTRYKFKQLIMDNPHVVIFANVMPDVNLLSMDRWKIWTIREGILEALPL